MLAQAALVPTGVNDAVLGKAEHFAVHGPGRLCPRAAWADLSDRKAVHLKYSGIHYQTIELAGPDGVLELQEGEAWAKPKGDRTRLLRRADMEVLDVGNEREFRYLVYGANQYSEERLIPMSWLYGGVLVGDARDPKLVSRIKIGARHVKECNISCSYGWGVLLEGDPMVTRRNERD
jgi:hypothetical protein